MPYEYKRRRPSLVRNFWVYRRLVGSAILLGVMLWFVWVNDAPVSVEFPFRLGRLESRLGMIILLSALFGSLLTFLTMTIVKATRKIRGPQPPAQASSPAQPDAEDRPPPDYAAKTTDGFSNTRWSG